MYKFEKEFLFIYYFIFSKVICMPDVKTLYRVPLLLEENGVFSFSFYTSSIKIKNEL